MLRREFLFLASVPALVPVQLGSALRFLAQNRYFARAGKRDEVYELRLHACDVLQRIGVSRGEVFRGGGGDELDAVWQVEFASREAAGEARRKVSADPEFTLVQQRMGRPIRRFESSVYQEVAPAQIDNKPGTS